MYEVYLKHRKKLVTSNMCEDDDVNNKYTDGDNNVMYESLFF